MVFKLRLRDLSYEKALIDVVSSLSGIKRHVSFVSNLVFRDMSL